jgi:hypothetical protein
MRLALILIQESLIFWLDAPVELFEVQEAFFPALLQRALEAFARLPKLIAISFMLMLQFYLF